MSADFLIQARTWDCRTCCSAIIGEWGAQPYVQPFKILKRGEKMQSFKFEGLQVGLRSPCFVLKIRIPGNQTGSAEKIASFRDAVLWRVCSGPGGSVEDENNRDSAPLSIFSAPPADRAPLLKPKPFQCWSRSAKRFQCSFQNIICPLHSFTVLFKTWSAHYMFSMFF